MRIKIITLVFVGLLMISPGSVMAAKTRVWKSTAITSSKAGGGNPSVTARLTGWKQYLNVSFGGVASTNGVIYELTFNGNNNEQGVYGSVKASEGNVTRSLFLGTCSNKACTSYKNINSLRLTVTYQMKNGQDVVKRYKVKY